jgi:FkbM family methyltransferase
LRAGSTDLWVFNQIFLRQEYRPAAGNLGTVLDLGANIGLASIYFLHRNPLAQVVAVEPDPDNYNLCVRNLKPYGDRAQVVLGAVWSESTRLVLSPHEDGKEWAVRVTEPSAGCPDQTVQGWSVPELLDRAGIEDLDLLKVDIEGSELALFSNSCEGWLPRVRNAVIELHGPACEDAFRQAMAGYQFEQAYSGELVLCRNIQRRDHQRKD